LRGLSKRQPIGGAQSVSEYTLSSANAERATGNETAGALRYMRRG
jgi:hypothetical protein